MLKYFIFFVLFFITLQAQSVVNIDSESVNITDFKMAYYVDKTQKMTLDEVKIQQFTESSNKISLGKTSNVIWTKVIIANKTDKNKKIFLHNPFAFTTQLVDFYEEENTKILNKSKFDLTTKEGALKMYGANAIFSVKLHPSETKTIYMQSKVFAYQYFSLLIYDEENSKRAISAQNIDIAFLVGILLSLAFFNMILYISSKHIEHLYYALFLISASLLNSNLYGLLANVFGLYGEVAYKTNFSLLVTPIFLVLFIRSIFNTKKDYEIEDKFLNSVLIIFTINLVYSFLNFTKALEIFSNLSIYMLIVFLFVSISIYKKGNILAKYFLVGHVLFLIFNSMAILFYDGLIQFNYITNHAVAIGVTLEALMLAYVVAFKIKLLENTLEDKVKRRTKELENSNYEFQHVLDNTMEGIAIFEDNGCVGVNDAALGLFKISDKSTAMGAKLLDYILPTYHSMVMENVKNNYGLPYEVIGERKDGSEFPMLAKSHTFLQEDKLLRIFSFIDLTKIKENEKLLELAKEKAEELTRVKSNFLANMSHEIRTPMNGIIGMIHLVKKTKLDEKQINYIDKVETASGNLLSIINDILDFSKMESGKLSIDKIDFDMNEVIKNVRNLVEFKAYEKKLKFSISFSQEDSIFYGDSLRIGQILINLLNNAIKFTNFGEVELLIEILEEDMVKFSIVDTGIGLNIDQQIKLFQSFNQVDTSITRKYGGTGLGLSISKQLVELMGGTIWIESEEHIGSEFIFEIKLPKGNKQNIRLLPNEADFNDLHNHMLTLKGSNILLVEDNSMNREIIHSLLEHSQINIDDAFDGAMAVELFEKNTSKYELILMDLQMPIMDGYQASEFIRTIDEDIPIIALTANAMREDAKQTKKAGMNEHINKPIDVEKLYETLLKYIPKKVKGQLATLNADELGIENKQDIFEIPEFKTIDTSLGLKHMAGNKKLYLKILNDFLENYKKFSLENLNNGEFKRATHTLKGLSANIGAISLHLVVKELDETMDKDMLKIVYAELEKVTQELAHDLIPPVELQIKNKKILAPSDKEALVEKLKQAALTNRPKNCETIMLEMDSYQLSDDENEVFKEMKFLLKKYRFKELVEKLDSMKVL